MGVPIRLKVAGFVLSCAVVAGAGVDADAKRGADFFEAQKCNTCHSVGVAVKAAKSGSAPDLASRLDRDYTPAGIASRMWNHAPTMWAAMKKQGIKPPDVSSQQAADLFAFFYSARYFETPGDAARGKRLFSEKRCADCHADAIRAKGTGPSIAQWDSVRDSVTLVAAMWNHIPRMKEEFAKRKITWPQMTSQDLADMLVYLRNMPEARRGEGAFAMSVGGGGAGTQVFNDKGCAGCHKDAMSLESKLGNRTLTGIAAEMWNHGPKMKQSASIAPEEMRSLLASVWARNFFASRGNAARGKTLFESKKCGTCHGAGGAPKLESADMSVIAMVSALWKHGPAMFTQLESKSMTWPQFTPNQMSDLVAYLSAPSKQGP